MNSTFKSQFAFAKMISGFPSSFQRFDFCFFLYSIFNRDEIFGGVGISARRVTQPRVEWPHLTAWRHSVFFPFLISCRDKKREETTGSPAVCKYTWFDCTRRHVSTTCSASAVIDRPRAPSSWSCMHVIQVRRCTHFSYSAHRLYRFGGLRDTKLLFFSLSFAFFFI